MESKIITIREVRERVDPDYFIDNVLNTPARLARVKAKRDNYWAEVQRRQAEYEEAKRDLAEQSEATTKAILGSMAIAFFATVIGGAV